MPSKKAEQAPGSGTPGPGHNGPPPPLTDEQRQALFFQHKRKYSAALAIKKEADAAFKNACKKAKAELGPSAVDSIKDALLLETPEGAALIEANIRRQAEIAKWMAVPFGKQADMFDGDMMPAVDRAKAEGRRDGLAGKTLAPPYDPSVPQYDAYAEAWHAAQGELFNIQRTRDASEFEGEEEGESEEAAA